MKLYQSPLSPYVRKVLVTAHEVGVADRIELTEGSGTPLAPSEAVVAVNPLGRIPALVTDEGATLVDSRVICRYLDGLGGGSLYVGDTFGILSREAMAEGMTDSALLVAYEGRLRPEEKQMPALVEGWKAKVLRTAAVFNARADELSGPLTIDQIGLAAALGYVDFRIPDLGWREGNPALTGWFETFSERPSMQATRPG